MHFQSTFDVALEHDAQLVVIFLSRLKVRGLSLPEVDRYSTVEQDWTLLVVPFD